MKSILLIGFILAAELCFAQTSNIDFNELYYLEGKWIIDNEDSDIHEEWTKENDSLLTCKSFYVKDGDTNTTEYVRLEKIGSDIYYIPLVKHNPGPVKFKLTSLEDGKAVFDNPEHDFPQRIIYHRVDDNTLNARIEGMSKGKLKAIDYPFTRVK